MRRAPELVFVTGAGSGIGRATALRFAGMGATVVVTDINEDSAQATVAQIIDAGGRAHSYRLDVSDAAAFEALAEVVRAEHGVPDVVVNNAGQLITGGLLQLTMEEWKQVLDVHLMGVVHGSRLFGAQMVDRGTGGHIVNVSSLAAFAPVAFAPSYCTAKAAIKMLSECIHIELAPHDIGVSAMCYGLINTNIAEHGVLHELSEQAVARSKTAAANLMPKLGSDPDVAAKAIVRAVRHNLTVVPVRPETWLMVGASRLSPGLVRNFGRISDPSNIDRLTRLAPKFLTTAKTAEKASR